MRRFVMCLTAVVALAVPAQAQDHVHTPGMQHPAADPPKEGGQSAFTAIAEIVRMLDADPRTDWSKVNIEALRQHLIDMDEVTMRATVRAESVAGGAAFTVTGSGRTLEAIRRMTQARARTGDATGAIRMSVAEVPDGVRFAALAANPSDARAVARIRGLGFIGVVALGDHHAPHHLGIANGSMAGMHGHE
ncbi:MAG: hypothetical protein KF689_13995 [Gemmatimonadaceae bacterium]|nr:hypothetical protein [Gemmatimonadaceae bacterium]MCW5826902.1 hypothetical protein [Gemmatimonadaceae bacterium]